MYTIRHASRLSGVAIPTLRAWERRYGIVRPQRTASGYRLYDDDAVERLVAMRRLVEDGWQASIAAAEIRVRGTAIAFLEQPLERAGAVGPPPGAGPVASGAPAGLAADVARRFVQAAAAVDGARVERVLDDVFAAGSFERVARDQLFPALRALGEAWASGEVSVAGEHLASHAVLRRLGLALDAAGRGEQGGQVVVGLPPGGRHELGALAFAVALRRAGVPVAYLGPDLPVDDWARAAAGAAAAAVGVVTARDRRAALEVVRRLRADRPDLLVALGGEASARVAEPGVVHLPPDLEASVDVIREALSRLSRPDPSR